MKDLLNRHFENLEKQVDVKLKNEYASLVNFSTRHSHPVHRWFYYHEAFSPELIEKVIENYCGQKKGSVIDPFNGGGTTTLVSSLKGIDSVGLEVNPFSYFLSKVKCQKYKTQDVTKIRKNIDHLKAILKNKTKHSVPALSIIDRLFDAPVLDELLSFKAEIHKVENKRAQDFLMLGWLCILERVSNYRKGGNGLKKRPRSASEKNVRQQLFTQIDLMLADVECLLQQEAYKHFVEPELKYLNCVNAFPNLEKKFDLAVFSPPYLNCFDYFEVYKTELWMGDFVESYDQLRQLRRNTLRSHLNATFKSELSTEKHFVKIIEPLFSYLKEQKLWDKKIPSMVWFYFEDMFRVLKNLSMILKPKGTCVIVVGNSAYANTVIPVDVLLATLSREAGFECEAIDVARRNETSSQQHKNLGNSSKYLRESLVILRRK
jgi:DNA modification methylase